MWLKWPNTINFEIFCPKTLFQKNIVIYHFLWYLSLVSSSTIFFKSNVARWHEKFNYKNKKKFGHLVLELGGLEYCSWYSSPSSSGTMLLIWRKNKMKNNNKNNNDNKSNNNKVFFLLLFVEAEIMNLPLIWSNKTKYIFFYFVGRNRNSGSCWKQHGSNQHVEVSYDGKKKKKRELCLHHKFSMRGPTFKNTHDMI